VTKIDRHRSQGFFVVFYFRKVEDVKLIMLPLNVFYVPLMIAILCDLHPKEAGGLMQSICLNLNAAFHWDFLRALQFLCCFILVHSVIGKLGVHLCTHFIN
jgi:hypothetical protein